MIKTGRVNPGQTRTASGDRVEKVQDQVPVSTHDPKGLTHPRSVLKSAKEKPSNRG